MEGVAHARRRVEAWPVIRGHYQEGQNQLMYYVLMQIFTAYYK